MGPSPPAAVRAGAPPTAEPLGPRSRLAGHGADRSLPKLCCKFGQAARSQDMAGKSMQSDVLLFQAFSCPVFPQRSQTHVRGARLLQLIFLTAFVLVLPVPSLAQASTDTGFTNADIVRMVKAGIPESIILR